MAKFKIEAGARHAPRPMQVLAVENETYQWLQDNDIDLSEGESGFDLQNFSEDIQEAMKENIPFTLPDSEDEDCSYPEDDYSNGYDGANVVHELIGIPINSNEVLLGYVIVVDDDGEELFRLSEESISKANTKGRETLAELKVANADKKLLFYAVEGDGLVLQEYSHSASDEDGWFEGEFSPQSLTLIVEEFGSYGRFVTDIEYKGESISADFLNEDGTDGGPWFYWECEDGHGNTWNSEAEAPFDED